MLIVAGLAGVALGGMFFGGLWWTLQKGMASDQPAAWFGGSLLVRMGLALWGFYVVSGGEWPRMVACLVGFAIGRGAVTWFTRQRPIDRRA